MASSTGRRFTSDVADSKAKPWEPVISLSPYSTAATVGSCGVSPERINERRLPPRTEKADVAEYQEVFDHVGLLTNEPLGKAGLLRN
jgi:hypothetical protein